MKLPPLTLSLIEAASAAYPDGLVRKAILETGQLYAWREPDSLADFIALEIADATRNETDPLVAALCASRAIERAAQELVVVGIALRRAEIRAGGNGLPAR